MADAIVPPDIFLIEPLWRNFFENVPLVQLDHRLLAMLTALAVILIWAAAFRWLGPVSARAGCSTRQQVAVLVQFVLGIATLLTFVPVPLGAAHQAGRDGGVYGDPGRASPAVSAVRPQPASRAALRPFTKRLMRRGHEADQAEDCEAEQSVLNEVAFACCERAAGMAEIGVGRGARRHEDDRRQACMTRGGCA